MIEKPDAGAPSSMIRSPDAWARTCPTEAMIRRSASVKWLTGPAKPALPTIARSEPIALGQTRAREDVRLVADPDVVEGRVDECVVPAVFEVSEGILGVLEQGPVRKPEGSTHGEQPSPLGIVRVDQNLVCGRQLADLPDPARQHRDKHEDCRHREREQPEEQSEVMHRVRAFLAKNRDVASGLLSGSLQGVRERTSDDWNSVDDPRRRAESALHRLARIPHTRAQNGEGVDRVVHLEGDPAKEHEQRKQDEIAHYGGVPLGRYVGVQLQRHRAATHPSPRCGHQRGTSLRRSGRAD